MNISKLNKLVESSRLNKSQIATRCGISRTTLDNVLNGADVKLSTVESLLGALGATMVDLYGGESVGNKAIASGKNSVAAINSNIDNRQYYSDSPDVLKAQIRMLEQSIKEKDAQIKEKDAQIKEKDAQINKLLEILANS